MAYKKMDEKEWIKIGNQAKRTREELFKLMDMSYGKMPKAVVEPLRRSVKHLDCFKSQAEDRMLKMGDSDSLDIFYGDIQNIDDEIE